MSTVKLRAKPEHLSRRDHVAHDGSGASGQWVAAINPHVRGNEGDRIKSEDDMLESWPDQDLKESLRKNDTELGEIAGRLREMGMTTIDYESGSDISTHRQGRPPIGSDADVQWARLRKRQEALRKENDEIQGILASRDSRRRLPRP